MDWLQNERANPRYSPETISGLGFRPTNKRQTRMEMTLKSRGPSIARLPRRRFSYSHTCTEIHGERPQQSLRKHFGVHLGKVPVYKHVPIQRRPCKRVPLYTDKAVPSENPVQTATMTAACLDVPFASRPRKTSGETPASRDFSSSDHTVEEKAKV